MQFTAEEVRFLSGPHSKREARSLAEAGWPSLPDDMPSWVRQRVLVYRAKKLGVFAEFRTHSRSSSIGSNDDLAQSIEAARLF